MAIAYTTFVAEFVGGGPEYGHEWDPMLGSAVSQFKSFGSSSTLAESGP